MTPTEEHVHAVIAGSRPRAGFDQSSFRAFDSFAAADAEDAREWLALTPIERLQALEQVRAANYGYAREDQPRPQFQRLYRVAELRKS